MSGPKKKRNPLLNIKTKKTETPIRVTDKRFWANKEKETSKGEKEYSFKPTYVQELEKNVHEVQKNAKIEVQESRDRIRNEHEKRILQSKGDLVKGFLDVFENGLILCLNHFHTLSTRCGSFSFIKKNTKQASY